MTFGFVSSCYEGFFRRLGETFYFCVGNSDGQSKSNLWSSVCYKTRIVFHYSIIKFVGFESIYHAINLGAVSDGPRI